MSGAFKSKSEPAADETLTKMISFLFHSADNSGVGCEHLCVHFRTSVSLYVFWKVWLDLLGTLQGWKYLSFKVCM